MEFGPTRNQLFQREEFPVFPTNKDEFLGDIGGAAGRDGDIDGGSEGRFGECSDAWGYGGGEEAADGCGREGVEDGIHLHHERGTLRSTARR
mmetsp:Transcript_44032/g.51580  ORF Transcript_44032/g.51580 Transcript_44032/m.51580 type:complete len:92 (+) Transcript_44032:213-488(+)